jgi:preprotein translocase subunit Sec63
LDRIIGETDLAAFFTLHDKKANTCKTVRNFFSVQASKRDYYKILGLRRNAGKKEITKAYRKLAQKWHPDNFQDETEKKAAEKKFMDIAAAKEVLTDDGKKNNF